MRKTGLVLVLALVFGLGCMAGSLLTEKGGLVKIALSSDLLDKCLPKPVIEITGNYGAGYGVCSREIRLKGGLKVGTSPWDLGETMRIFYQPMN